MQWAAVSTRSRLSTIPLQRLPRPLRIITSLRYALASTAGAPPTMAEAGSTAVTKNAKVANRCMIGDQPQRVVFVNRRPGDGSISLHGLQPDEEIFRDKTGLFAWRTGMALRYADFLPPEWQS